MQKDWNERNVRGLLVFEPSLSSSSLLSSSSHHHYRGRGGKEQMYAGEESHDEGVSDATTAYRFG